MVRQDDYTTPWTRVAAPGRSDHVLYPDLDGVTVAGVRSVQSVSRRKTPSADGSRIRARSRAQEG